MYWYSLLAIAVCLLMAVIAKIANGSHDPTAAGYLFAATVLLPVFLNALYDRRDSTVMPEIDATKTANARIKIGSDVLMLNFEKNQVHVTHLHGNMRCAGFRLDVLPSDYYESGWPASMRLYFRWQQENEVGHFDPMTTDHFGTLLLGSESEVMTLPGTAIRYGGPDPDRMARVWVERAELFPRDKPHKDGLAAYSDKPLVAAGEPS